MRTRDMAHRQEKRLAKEMGGVVIPGSGSIPGMKGDVRVLGKFRIEAKATGTNRFMLRLATLRKIMLEAESAGEAWALQVEFGGAVGGTSRTVVMDYALYMTRAVLPLEKIYDVQRCFRFGPREYFRLRWNPEKGEKILFDTACISMTDFRTLFGEGR